MVPQRLRVIVGLTALVELVVFLVVAAWIGLGWTLLATLATGAMGWVLLARQGTKALTDLRERARTRQPAGRELGDAGLVAVGGLLMVLPGFLSDVVGLLFLLPVTRRPARALLGRVLVSRLPIGLRGPVRVRSDRTAPVGGATRMEPPLVIEGEVVRDTEPTP
ncbi:MAG: FxsA cytoplasmic rane protein [Blastococcus sp.]|nr:FxsA cytoplasmic rane protein [Blastococcus sp.]